MKFLVDLFNRLFLKSIGVYSDAQILRIVQEKGIVTSSQVAGALDITTFDAYTRLAELQYRGALKYLYDDMGTTSYTFKEDVPDIEFLESLNSGELDTDSILNLSRELNGQAQPVHLCLMADIPLKEAKKHFKNLKKVGAFKTVYTSEWKSRYILANFNATENKKVGTSKKQRKALSQNIKVISDADIIKLAIECKGKLTTTSLCLKKEINVEEAKNILEGLHDRNIFDIHVNENGTIEYWLNDKSLLE